MELLDGADLSKLRVDVGTLLQMIKWLDFAIDGEIMENITPETSVKQLKKLYREKMETVTKVLKKGIYK